mmetsp:Transcript_2785/g.6539  ORF Transcript_2785/g.6539 Transcript_2785/m.6539 type:complete len:214 (-) Transcript_2785:1497-2138(-)
MTFFIIFHFGIHRNFLIFRRSHRLFIFLPIIKIVLFPFHLVTIFVLFRRMRKLKGFLRDLVVNCSRKHGGIGFHLLKDSFISQTRNCSIDGSVIIVLIIRFVISVRIVVANANGRILHIVIPLLLCGTAGNGRRGNFRWRSCHSRRIKQVAVHANFLESIHFMESSRQCRHPIIRNKVVIQHDILQGGIFAQSLNDMPQIIVVNRCIVQIQSD